MQNIKLSGFLLSVLGLKEPLCFGTKHRTAGSTYSHLGVSREEDGSMKKISQEMWNKLPRSATLVLTRARQRSPDSINETAGWDWHLAGLSGKRLWRFEAERPESCEEERLADFSCCEYFSTARLCCLFEKGKLQTIRIAPTFFFSLQYLGNFAF